MFRVGTIAERIACIKEYQIIQDDIGLYTINVVVSAPLHDFETKVTHRKSAGPRWAGQRGREIRSCS